MISKLVNSIEIFPVDNFVCTRINALSVSIPNDVEWIKIQIKPFAKLSISDKFTDKNRLWSSELSFYTAMEIPTDIRFVWKIGLTNGKFILLGDGKRPYPIHTVVDDFPDNPTENQLSTVKVTYTARHKMTMLL